jgi:hypothetical protein
LAASLAGAGPVMTVAGHSYTVPPAAFEGGGGKRGRAEAFLLHITWPGLKRLAFADLFEPSEQLDSLLVLAINGRNDGGRMTTTSKQPSSGDRFGRRPAPHWKEIHADLVGFFHANEVKPGAGPARRG